MLDDLTPQQRAAVTHPGGPLLVIAGAGAGKTRVLGRRLAWLVERGARPDEILALTFTSDAAHELRGRAERAIGASHETLRVSTFHAHAMRIMREHGDDPAPRRPAAGDERALMLLDRLAQLDLVEHDPRRDPAALVDQLIRRIDRCKDELVDATSFARWADEALAGARGASVAAARRRDREFARVFLAHDRWLEEAGLEDFGESIVRALRLLRARPDRLAAAQLATRHVLVDEFQDTNHAQAELLYLLARDAESLVVVGDDDQGIYRFRGASAKNVADFRARFPRAGEARLELNHRSTQAILDAAHAVVEPLADRRPKRLVACAGADGPMPRLAIAPDPEGQARAVADEVVRVAAEGVAYEEQAILMRSVRNETAPVVRALERAGVPYQVRGGTGLFERREVRSAVAWLRMLVDPADAQAHLRVAADPELQLPWPPAAEAVAEAAAARRPVTAALLDVARRSGAERVVDLVGALGAASLALAPPDLVREVVDRTGLRRAALAVGGAEGAARLAGLAALERLVDEIDRLEPRLSAAELARRLEGLAAVGYRGQAGAGPERLGVQVLTVHAAKGLEFDAVIVVGLVDANLPGPARRGVEIPDALLPEAIPAGRDAHVAEARRLAYVAMTRARRHLTLLTYRAGAGGAAQRLSRFWEEARSALGVEAVEVGRAPERDVLAAVGRSREAWERASRRASDALAADAGEAPALLAEAQLRAGDLVRARAAALRPVPPAPAPTPPPRPARPGIELSPTDVERYRTCPLAFRFARIDRVPPRRSPARAVGVAAHAALEAHHRPGRDEGDADALVRRFAGELARHGVGEAAEGRHALARAREWLPRYHQRAARAPGRTVAVERPFTLRVGPHVVRGRVDRVDVHPCGRHQLVDYKTGRPPTDAGRGDDDLVLRLYLAGARDAWGVDARGATLEYVLDGGVRHVHAEPEEEARALDEVRRVAEAAATGDLEPRPGWACRTCDFALLCPAQDR